jgi:hypothetical protein
MGKALALWKSTFGLLNGRIDRRINLFLYGAILRPSTGHHPLQALVHCLQSALHPTLIKHPFKAEFNGDVSNKHSG